MIQFNLLPDIKLEYIKAKRTKRLVILSAVGVAGAAIGIFVLLFITVNLFQKQHIGNLNDDIKKYSNELKGVEDLDRILTVQNQLNKLTELHDKKAVLSRLKNYISQVTPQQVSFAEIELDTEFNTMRFTGSADTIKTINQFVDTLKFTKYSLADDDENQLPAFSEVVLTSFQKDSEAGFTYEIDFKYDPAIFSSQSEIKLSVPNIITTRSAIERPSENILQPITQPAEGN